MRAVAARGKTIVFATHYLEEADAFADRIVLLAHGSDRGRRAYGRDQGSGRRPDDPGDAPRGRPRPLRALPGVLGVERHGDAVILTSDEAETALRGLLRRFP